MKSATATLAGDDGRVSVYFAIVFTAVLIIIGVCYDGSGKNHTRQRANNLAAEAARAGGQAIELPTAITGGAKLIDPARAADAARAYLTAAGVAGECGAPPPSACVQPTPDRLHLDVTVALTYRTAMLSFIGITQVDVSGHATAELLTG